MFIWTGKTRIIVWFSNELDLEGPLKLIESSLRELVA